MVLSSKTHERDAKQRLIGFIAFSALVHMFVVGGIFISTQPFRADPPPANSAVIAGGTTELLVDSVDELRNTPSSPAPQTLPAEDMIAAMPEPTDPQQGLHETAIEPEATASATSVSDSVSGSTTGAGDSGAVSSTLATQTNPVLEASERTPLANNRPPVYPQQDRLLRREGVTVLIGRIGTNGLIDEVQIEKSSGSDSLDRAALDAFRKWKFAPGPEARVRKSFAFRLTGEEQMLPARLREN